MGQSRITKTILGEIMNKLALKILGIYGVGPYKEEFGKTIYGVEIKGKHTFGKEQEIPDLLIPENLINGPHKEKQ